MKNIMYEEFCTGCGLCHAIYGMQMGMDDKGFLKPIITSEDNSIESKLKEICPCYGVQNEELDSKFIWGKSKNIAIAYSSNSEIRYEASSGGVITELCVHLLEENEVDGVLQIGPDPVDPISSTLYCSRTPEEVKSNCGSRYSSSSPLYNITSFIKTNERYVFVGKPCDVTAVKNWMQIDKTIKSSIIYTISFFCAGVPSRNANLKLLEKMKCEPDKCQKLNYRGNGWPGYATAVDTHDVQYKLSYQEAWRDTLGRDIRKICRFCIDSVGEMADISCGDAWYLDDSNKPIFEEHKGRNIVFCRSQRGQDLFNEAVQAGEISVMHDEEYIDNLQYSQAHQYFKRKTMSASIIALKICGKASPNWNWKELIEYSKGTNIILLLRKFGGTIKRVFQKKI